MSRVFQLAIAIALLVSCAAAQARIEAFSAGRPGHGSFGHGIRPIGSSRPHHHFSPAYGYYGLPYFYSDYEPYEEYVPEPQPVPAPPMQVKAEPVPDPELLELRDGQWVRVTTFTQTSSRAPASSPISSTKPLPPVVLVFRDGHTEDVNSYSIIGGSIYTKANYWSTGKWTRGIQLAELNIAATIEQNRRRGINFELPSNPDEIMIRP